MGDPPNPEWVVIYVGLVRCYYCESARPNSGTGMAQFRSPGIHACMALLPHEHNRNWKKPLSPRARIGIAVARPTPATFCAMSWMSSASLQGLHPFTPLPENLKKNPSLMDENWSPHLTLKEANYLYLCSQCVGFDVELFSLSKGLEILLENPTDDLSLQAFVNYSCEALMTFLCKTSSTIPVRPSSISTKSFLVLRQWGYSWAPKVKG
ncbi:hypothetical protein VNO77_03641 [Canavalia gladiata]|uniref:Uncharacterized protein n=1 Tax=Canavalia gladiata TaxID=3824 RepID=A0AAN9MX37_CANGL